jgi:hypothetical protein
MVPPWFGFYNDAQQHMWTREFQTWQDWKSKLVSGAPVISVEKISNI